MSKASKSKITSSAQDTKTTDGSQHSWTTLSIDDEKPSIPMPTFVKLNEKSKIKKYKFGGIFTKLRKCWHKLFLTTVFINYFLIGHTYFVWRPSHNNHAPFYIAIGLDAIYFINFALQILTMSIRKVKIGFYVIQMIILETLLVFPFWLIYEKVFNRNDGIYLVLRTISMIRIHKIVIPNTTINRLYKELLKLLIYFLIFMQTFVCVWFTLHCPFWTNNCKSLISNHTENITQWYLATLHYVIKTGFGSGFILHASPIELSLIGIGTLITSIFITAYISILFTFLMIIDKRILKYHLQLNQFLCHYAAIGLKENAINNLKKYYKIMWTNKRGLKRSDLLQIGPRSVHSDVKFDINLPALKCSLIFRNCAEVYLRCLSDLMRHECYCEGEYVYKRLEDKNKMIVVVSGVIDIMAEEDDSVAIVSFGPGTCLGEAALVATFKARCSVKARDYVETQVLHRVDFYSTIPYYQKQQNKITKIIKARILEAHIKRRGNRQTFVKKVKETNFTASSLLTLYKIFKSHKYTRYIPKNSNLNKIWEIFVIINAIVIGVCYPYFVAFRNKFPPEFVLVAIAMELILVIDVFLQLITSENEKDSNRITLKRAILKKLDGHEFYLDVISAFYFEYFAYLFRQNSYFYVFKLNRVLKFYKVIRVFQGDFAGGGYALRLAKFLLLFGFVTFWLSTVAFIESCFDYDCVDESWYKLKLVAEKNNQTERPMFASKFWFSAYFALSHLVGFEIHELFLVRIGDVVYSSLVLIFGVLLIGFFVAYLSVVIYMRLKAKFNFLEQIEMLNELFVNAPMPKSMQRRLMNFYCAQWEYNGGFRIRENVLISNDIEEEIVVKERVECLNQVEIFSVVDEGFVKAIAAKSKMYVLPPGDFVTYTGSMNKEMFAIVEGLCVYKNSNGRCRSLGPNSIFGTCSLFFNLAEPVTVRTVTHCKLISIDGTALQDALVLYPLINEAIKESYKDIPCSEHHLNAASMSDFNWNELSKFDFDLAALKQFGKIPFINVVNYCSKHKELYSKPFKRLDTFYILKFILMPVTILPDGCFIKVWMMFRLAIAFAYGIAAPIQQILSPHHATFHYTMFFSDIVLYLDIYVMLHVCYYDDNNQLVIHPLKTALNYVKGQFLLDLLIGFPYEIIIYLVARKQHVKSSEECAHFLYCFVRLTKVLQVYKIYSAFAYWEKKISKKVHVQIVKYALASVFVINLWSCMLIYLSCEYITDADSTKNRRYAKQYNYQLGKPGWYFTKDSWLANSQQLNLLDIYSTTFYWTCSLMVALNFDNYQVHGADLMVSVGIMLSGTVFFIYMIANLIPYFLINSNKALEYQADLRQMMTFLNLEKVDRKLKLKLKRNAEYMWRRTGNIDVTSLLSTLHTTLLQDTLCCFYEDTLKQVRLFERLDRSYLRLIMMIIKPRYFLKDQIIVRSDDIVDEFYIIDRGSVHVDMSRSIIQANLRKGGIFGYFYNESTPVMTITATVTSDVDVLCIKTSDFYNMLKNYKIFNKKIKEVVTEYKDFMYGSDSISNLHPAFSPKIKKRATFCQFCAYYFFQDKVFECLEFIWLMASYASCLTTILQFTFQIKEPLSLNIILDILIVFKLILKFHQPYYNGYGEHVTSKQAIKARYLANNKIQFTLEMFICSIACFSQLIFYFNFERKEAVLYYTSVRLCTILRGNYIRKYFGERKNRPIARKLLLMALNVFLWFTLLLHYVANALCLLDCRIGHCEGEKNLFKSSEKDAFSRYASAMFLTINLTTYCGMSEINPRSNLLKVLMGVFCVASKFILAILIAKFINIFWFAMKSNLKYGYKLTELRDYMECANVNPFQIGKALRYFRRSWTNDAHRKWPTLLDRLPSPITTELKIDLYKPILQGTYIFSGTEDHFLRNIAALLERTIYYPGNCIVYDSQIDERMYFIKEGEVEVLTFNSNLTETVHDVLHRTEMFGLAQGIFNNVPHQFTFRARTRVEILSLQLMQWEHLLKFYSRSKHIIYKRVRDMHVQLNE